jgi:hypothetical protein
MPTGNHCLTPLAAVAGGLLAGAVGTVCLDTVQYLRYRRTGGRESLLAWEFAPVPTWDKAPAPGQVARRVIEGFTPGLSVLVTALIGRPEDEITAGITTTVVMVAASLSPHDAWRQPILRLADTAIGVAVGLVAAWLGLRAVRPLIRPSSSQTLGEYAP